MISDYDREHVRDLLMGHGDWFTAQLLRLIAKADPENRVRLRHAFPEEVQLYEDYMGSIDARREELLQKEWTAEEWEALPDAPPL